MNEHWLMICVMKKSKPVKRSMQKPQGGFKRQKHHELTRTRNLDKLLVAGSKSSFVMVPSSYMDSLIHRIDKLQASVQDVRTHMGAQKSTSPKLKFISRTELAKKLGVTLPTLDKWKNEGAIPFRRIRRRIYFSEAEVLKAMQSNERFKNRI